MKNWPRQYYSAKAQMLLTRELLKTIIAILALFCSLSTNAEKNNTIEWLTDDARDEHSFLHQQKVSIGTDTTNLVLNQLNNYTIYFKLAQIPRIDKILKTQTVACTSNRIKTTERLKHNVFSFPVNLYPGLRLYYLEDEDDIPTDYLNEQGDLVSISEYFQKMPKKILGVTKGRSFGPDIDAEIVKIKSRNVFYRTGNGRYSAIIKMLVKGRINYLIAFPVEIQRELQAFPKDLKIKSYSIASSPKYIVGYIACTKTPLGYQVVEEINQILKKSYKTLQYYEAHSHRLDSNYLPLFNQYYHEVFDPYLK